MRQRPRARADSSPTASAMSAIAACEPCLKRAFQAAASVKLALSSICRSYSTGHCSRAAPKRAGKIAVALRERLRRIAGELRFRESPETQYLIDHESCGNIAMIDDQDARVARQHGGAAAQKLPQVDHREQMAADIRKSLDPALPPARA